MILIKAILFNNVTIGSDQVMPELKCLQPDLDCFTKLVCLEPVFRYYIIRKYLSQITPRTITL